MLTLRRTSECGKAPLGHALVQVADLVVGADRHPALGRRRENRRLDLAACKPRVLRIPSGRPPFQVDVQVKPTYNLSKYGFPSDTRDVGAVVGYSFVPAKA